MVVVLHSTTNHNSRYTDGGEALPPPPALGLQFIAPIILNRGLEEEAELHHNLCICCCVWLWNGAPSPPPPPSVFALWQEEDVRQSDLTSTPVLDMTYLSSGSTVLIQLLLVTVTATAAAAAAAAAVWNR
ncbi:hypothetical protein L6452_09405 [Arctium lappa]|uniref:Uncharacterized protein n=1 Tax=Arctium lappa TaxID=4217 RepID=A0ACB9DJX8_ARCLA|nr:hypothetical protein L6452_09405 [Arctium lappa]